jgi:hypothetical protein
MQEASCDLDPSFHSAREILHETILLIQESDIVQEAFDPLFPLAFRDPVQGCMVIEVLIRSEVVINRVVLEDDTDRFPDLILLIKDTNPLIEIEPSVGERTVVIILMVVDLPAPLGPRKAKMLPFSTLKLMASTAVNLPKSLVRSLTSIIGFTICYHEQHGYLFICLMEA